MLEWRSRLTDRFTRAPRAGALAHRWSQVGRKEDPETDRPTGGGEDSSRSTSDMTSCREACRDNVSNDDTSLHPPRGCEKVPEGRSGAGVGLGAWSSVELELSSARPTPTPAAPLCVKGWSCFGAGTAASKPHFCRLTCTCVHVSSVKLRYLPGKKKKKKNNS